MTRNVEEKTVHPENVPVDVEGTFLDESCWAAVVPLDSDGGKSFRRRRAEEPTTMR